MSMGLHTLPGVYQASWIEMESDVTMRYEVDRASESATLFFGNREEYVITLGRNNLKQLLNLGSTAWQELDRSR